VYVYVHKVINSNASVVTPIRLTFKIINYLFVSIIITMKMLKRYWVCIDWPCVVCFRSDVGSSFAHWTRWPSPWDLYSYNERVGNANNTYRMSTFWRLAGLKYGFSCTSFQNIMF